MESRGIELSAAFATLIAFALAGALVGGLWKGPIGIIVCGVAGFALGGGFIILAGAMVNTLKEP